MVCLKTVVGFETVRREVQRSDVYLWILPLQRLLVHQSEAAKLLVRAVLTVYDLDVRGPGDGRPGRADEAFPSHV